MRFRLIPWRWLFSIVLLVVVIGSISGYAVYKNCSYRNLHTVKAGVMYRSGQLSPRVLERVIYEYNIGTVVNLRGSTAVHPGKSVDQEEHLCFKNFTQFVAIPLGSSEHRKPVSPGDAYELIDQAVQQFLDVLNDPVNYPRPILVHCLAGVHRTGVMIALYRMEHEGWSKEQALAEMQEYGYTDTTQYDPLLEYIRSWTLKRKVSR